MEEFSEPALLLMNRMVKAGWGVEFTRNQNNGKPPGWTFSKLCKTAKNGEFWRMGYDPDIERAAERALKAKAGTK